MDAAGVDQLVAKVLREELREEGNTREQSLEQFRDWILKNPDIQDCVTDDIFLLAFLRARKHSLPMAEDNLFRLLKFQHKFPSISSSLDIQDAVLNEIISNGYIFNSPFRVPDGSVLHITIAKKLDTNKHDFVPQLKCLLLNWHALMWDETAQVLGTTFIYDYGEVPAAYFTSIPLNTLKAVSESFEKTFPMRFKSAHLLNLPAAANWVMKMAMSMLSEKLRSRVFFHSSVEELHKHIDPSVLPKEYGGTMPMEEMIGLWKKKLAVHREAILAVNKIRLVGDSFKNDLESDETGIPGLPGSFRQLGVD